MEDIESINNPFHLPAIRMVKAMLGKIQGQNKMNDYQQ